MKKFLISCMSAILLLTLVSCATMYGEPTVVGQWTRKENGETVNYYFTEDGYCLAEYIGTDYSDYEFGEYEINGNIISGAIGTFPFEFTEKGIAFNGVNYRRASRKAVNNSNNPQGVWTNDDYSLGIASDGLIISMGRYMNCSEWEAENNSITAAKKSSDYIIINNHLFIDSFRFLGSKDIIKLTRNSSGGINKSNLTTLCTKGPWFYRILDRADIAGNIYSFSLNGTFVGYTIENGQQVSSFSGTYTFEDNRIHLSNGNTLIFGYIDETPFGY